jgi:hypothetical protein
LQVIGPTDGTGAAKKDERKLRYVLVSTAALGQATARPYLFRCGAWTERTIAGRGIKFAIEIGRQMHSRGSSSKSSAAPVGFAAGYRRGSLI